MPNELLPENPAISMMIVATTCPGAVHTASAESGRQSFAALKTPEPNTVSNTPCSVVSFDAPNVHAACTGAANSTVNNASDNV